jgi:AbrB family transcriptional regulator (stage V sporulation protein T)
VEGVDRFAVAGAPIIAAGDVCGVIMFLADESSGPANDAELKLISTAAAFLGKQMEE